jgi:hypothetical protein
VTTLADHNLLPHLPEWIRFGDPADAHPAAFAAWIHDPSRCVLLKLWLGDYTLAGAGTWLFDVRHPDGRRRPAWWAAIASPASEEPVLQSAGVVVKQLTQSIDQARP